MFKDIYGLSCIENQVLMILSDRGENVAPLYFDSAVPISALFDYCMNGGRLEYFDRIERIQDVLKRAGVIDMRLRCAGSEEVFDIIGGLGNDEYLLLRCRDKFVREKLHARGLRDDHYVRVQRGEGRFIISNDIPHVELTVTEEELKELYGGDLFEIKALRAMESGDRTDFLKSRRYSPEDYVPTIYDIGDIKKYPVPAPKFGIIAGLYKTLIKRLAVYYSDEIDTGFIERSVPEAEKCYALLEYFNVKGNIELEKYFEVFCRLNYLEIRIMTELKRKLKEKQKGRINNG